MTSTALLDELRRTDKIRETGEPLARIRHAATLIIVRQDGPKPRLLMGRRNGGMTFMPGKWVFPGGRLDRSDFTAPSANDLRPEVQAKLSHLPRHRNTAHLPRAVAMAAVRETFEEVGLLLAKPAPPRPGAGPWRDFLAQGAQADLAALSFVARAITPPYRPKRYDTRFFLAQAESLLSLERQADCGELDEAAWLELDETLDLELAPITRLILKELPLRLAEPERPITFMRGRGPREYI
jgi:8-oxo-dGTP pyrophosphatase MutT (NUDIX family)